MSHLLIELYTATPTWKALSAEQRNTFFTRIGAGMQQLDPACVAPLAMGRVASEVPHASAEQYYAVWRCASRADADALMDAISATGWHDCFATTNAVGAVDAMAQHLADLAAL